jgi:hypothetical protein
VSAQGYVTRVRRAGAEEVESAIRRVSCIQLDSISTVEFGGKRDHLAHRQGTMWSWKPAKQMLDGCSRPASW